MGGLTSSDIFIVVTLISIILVLVIIIVVLDILSKKNKREDIEIDKIFADEKEHIKKLESSSINTPSRIEEIRYVEEDEELEKTKAKLELLALKEELERQKEQDNLSPLAESVEEEVFNQKNKTVDESNSVLEVPTEPVKYNFDKMVASVKLDNEEKNDAKPLVEEDEVKAYPVENEKIELPIEEINNVKIEENTVINTDNKSDIEEDKKFDRIIKEEPIIENVSIKPTLREFDPIKVEKLEVQPNNPIEPITQIVPEVEIQEITPEEKKEEIQEIASNINEDLKEVKQANLVRVNEIQQDLNDILNNKEYEITKYEDMQEKSAIISVEELTKLSEEVYDNNENYQMSYEDEGNEPISIKELEKLYNTTDLREVTEVIKNEPKISEEKVVEPTIEFKRLEDLPPISSEIKFKSSPFISPVFGVTETPASLELEQTANLDKLNDEIKKTNEFLNRLKELQKNLD